MRSLSPSWACFSRSFEAPTQTRFEDLTLSDEGKVPSGSVYMSSEGLGVWGLRFRVYVSCLFDVAGALQWVKSQNEFSSWVGFTRCVFALTGLQDYYVFV